MKQNQKKRYNNGRFNNRNARQLITRNTVMDSTGPCGKLRGTALQLFEKYQAGAKDALMQNDIVLAQSCMQYADHYMRLQNQAIQNEQMARSNNQNQHTHVVEVKEDKTELVEEEKDELPTIEILSIEPSEVTEDKDVDVETEVKEDEPVKPKRKGRVKKTDVTKTLVDEKKED